MTLLVLATVVGGCTSPSTPSPEAPVTRDLPADSVQWANGTTSFRFTDPILLSFVAVVAGNEVRTSTHECLIVPLGKGLSAPKAGSGPTFGLTWDPQSPLVGTLDLTALVYRDVKVERDEDGFEWKTYPEPDILGTVTGAPGLRLTIPALGLGAKDEFNLVAGVPSDNASQAAYEQEVRVAYGFPCAEGGNAPNVSVDLCAPF